MSVRSFNSAATSLLKPHIEGNLTTLNRLDPPKTLSNRVEVTLQKTTYTVETSLKCRPLQNRALRGEKFHVYTMQVSISPENEILQNAAKTIFDEGIQSKPCPEGRIYHLVVNKELVSS